ncbi:hypothetical protein [Streptomyces tauricus]|uniref:hypothetical protein n=1 Tax=Streptomyces tauricus TaxID=68274 RepID=UPI00341CC34E
MLDGTLAECDRSRRRLGQPLTRTRTSKGPVVREDLDQALSGTGHDQVRILALYDDEYTRERTITALTPYLEESAQAADWDDNHDHQLIERLRVRLRRMPALVSPTPVDWDLELSFLSALEGTALTGVWVETIWNPRKRTPRRGQTPDRYDPKRDLRRHFHRRGMDLRPPLRLADSIAGSAAVVSLAGR